MKRGQGIPHEEMVADELLAALNDGLQGMDSTERAKVATTIIHHLSLLKNLKALEYAMMRFRPLPKASRDEVFGLVRAKLAEVEIKK